MSNLPGNPHEEEAENAQTTEGALVHAVMAVAFELRTQTIATLNKAAADIVAGMDDIPAEVEAAIHKQADLITERLGGTP